MKTKFYRNTFLIIFTLLSVVSLFSQNSVTTLDKLKSKNWKMIFPTEREYLYVETYLNDSIVSNFSYDATIILRKDVFYLSFTPESTFDYTKVGSCQNGNYIIVLNPLNNELKKYQIIQLTDTFLELKNTDDRSLVLKYEAVLPPAP